ncbi:MAG TPA: hypothetical protein VGI41_08380, partial [Candidatus Udaeobacter sp.]
FLRVPPFLVSNNYTALLAERRKTARHGFVIGKAAIPMQFNPVCKASVDVIEGERPLHVPRDLDALPGVQVTVYLASSFLQLFLKRLNRGIKIDIMFVGMSFQILQAPLQFKDRFFKIERLNLHE